MADSIKALKHHGLAGRALKKGDMKTAAHHMGHAMSALRSTAVPGLGAQPKVRIPAVAPVQEGDEPDLPIQAPSKLRGALSRFGKGL